MKKPKYIVIHHTAVSRDKNPDQWEAVDQFHKSKFKFISSLGYYGGYNYEISAEGSIKQFRADGERTAAQYQKGMNDGRAISICMDGNFDSEEPTDDQIYALRGLVERLMHKYGIKPQNVVNHRSVAKYKSCPGNNIPDDVLGYIYSEPVENHVIIKLVKDIDGPEIYLEGKDGKYHHIENEKVFKALFGGFKDVVWEEKPKPKKISFSIKGQ